ILHGRQGVMPAQKHVLSEDQIRMLAAYVWGLSNK
ncbi:MAG TPA: cytochrome-c oxidase, cbb3-type subunit III, partial [Advenella sp.]|nr:cytochrome-c oxidase, cbb3-type subunit III [Advenella sp.]